MDDRGRCRVRLCSSGRDVEVGVWLPADDRGEFADALSREMFRFSILYLAATFAALMIDRAVGQIVLG